jgi:hypothetical protein
MWRILPALLLIAGCATQLPPPPGDAEAKRFESIPDKSVIYVVRQPVDSDEGRTLTLDDSIMITTFKGTFYRWEVAPGTHRIAGFAGANEAVTLTTAPGRIYFVQHTVLADRRDGTVALTSLREIGDQAGRNLVSRGQLIR